MLTHRLIVRNPAVAARAKILIDSLPFDPAHEVVIRERGKNRTRNQDSLYFDWCGIIGGVLGYTKQEIHEEMKRLFLLPILIRDDEEFAETWRAVEAVEDPGERERLQGFITRKTSITEASVKQMREYMTDVDHHAASLDIRLPHPDDERIQ